MLNFLNYKFYLLNINLLQTLMGDLSKIVVGTRHGYFIVYIMQFLGS